MISKVAFVILHYKDIDTTRVCIDSILRMDYQERIRIIVVDNDINAEECDRRETIDSLKISDNVTILPAKENGGFSYGNNIGYCYAREVEAADVIILVNNDVEFRQKDFIEVLETCYKSRNCSIIAPEVVKRSNLEYQNPMDKRIPNIREVNFTIFWNRLCLGLFDVLYPLLSWKINKDYQKKLEQKSNNSQYYNQVQEDIVPFGACIILLPEFVKREDLALKPDTHFYYEEYLLALRSEIMNYKIIYYPQIKVWHDSGIETQKSNKSRKTKLRFTMRQTLHAAEIYKQELLTYDNRRMSDGYK